MKRRVQLLHVILAGIVFSAVVLHAGITGKIAGDVIDQDTQQKLIGANIIVEGTMMGAATSADGYFNILNVPPGTYTLKATMMGYMPMIIQGVRVSIDQTSKINFTLNPTVVESDETVTIVADKPLVKPDMTSSLASVSSEEIEALPVSNMGQVLAIQAGVVQSGGSFHIRGGRAGEVAFWVDGVATTDVYSGGMGVAVENSAIQELQVVSGTFNAEYGQAMSGIVNIITKEGDKNYTGNFSAYVGDYVSNGEVWDVITKVNREIDPETGAYTMTSEKKNPLADFNPVYNTEFNLSGPVPLLGNKVTFFANARYQSTEGWVYGSEWFTPQGYTADSTIVPMNPYWRLSSQGKLTWQVNSNLKVSYNLFYNTWQNDRVSQGRNWRYNPNGMPLQKGNGLTHIFALNHVLSQNTFYELRVTNFYNEYQNYVLENPDAACDYLISVKADTSRDIEAFIFDPDTDPATLDYVNEQDLTWDYIVDPDGPMGYVHADSAAQPIDYSYLNSGMIMTQNNRSTSYWIGKFDLTSQVARAHQMKTGFELRTHELTYDNFTIREALDDAGKPMTPFKPMVPEPSTVYHDLYTRNPYEFSAYVQDKIELKEVNINVGVRFDYFNSNSDIPVDPHDPNIYSPYSYKNIYKGWVDPPASYSQAERDAYIASYADKEYTPEERRAFMLTKAEANYAISPRLGIAYPITDRGVIHFSYGHFFQTPNFQQLYANPDFKLSESGGYTIFGNPDLKPQRTVQYEIGLQQQLSDNIGIDVTLFYKDIRDWVGTSPLIETPINAIKYSQYENKEYANVRGITIKFEKRYSQNYSAGLDYSFMVAEGTYSNPNDAFNAINNSQEPLKSIIPLAWDQAHTLNGRFSYRFGTWTGSLIGRYMTGQPYTPSFTVGEVVGSTAQIGLRDNSARLPSQKTVDLHINKRFPVSGMYMDVFLNVYNLFDTRDEVTVYTDTGTAEYTTAVRPEQIGYKAERVAPVEDYVIQPGWYTAPRQIQLGLSLGF
ncbi:TonB-dependent receptor [bacterium]|nr:TonB-dependent receptor [bacterium]